MVETIIGTVRRLLPTLQKTHVFKIVWRFSAAALAVISSAAVHTATAAPANLSKDADVAVFASLIKAYSNASRINWVVAAPTLSAANAVLANISQHLEPNDQFLLQRVKAESAENSANPAEASNGPVGWIESQSARSSGAPPCSWQVWVADPAVPSAGQGAANIPLAPNDRLPVNPTATFRIGFTGLLQSKVYAFGETRPGSIRDLADSPDVNIPVASDAPETIVLAISRQPTPFLEEIRTALASSNGQRIELGKEHALRDSLLGHGRGIGANIQLVGPNMVTAKTASKTVVASADTKVNDLMEICTFSLSPLEAMR
jgi:hypothetical protein